MFVRGTQQGWKLYREVAQWPSLHRRSRPGAKVTPSRFEFTVEPDKEPIIPEFRIEKLEKLHGRAVDAEGNPVRDAVVRFYHHMQGSDYQAATTKANFSLIPMERSSLRKKSQQSQRFAW